ncbi:GNAT family protein [Phytomonospora sp. NPDC050363]|uniref:GNAT family N-acetyltransferase n=1 Tax=Phytomonospora sp. NPDC050363 TaxID=3155642 RepID=UPI0033E44BFC
MTSSSQYAAIGVHDSIWTGRRVRLRGLEPKEWQRFRDNDLNTTSQRLGDRVHPPRSNAGYEKWALEQSTRPSSDEMWLVIADINDDRPVGSICTNRLDPTSGVFWYGVGIFREEQRRGYATEAIRIVQRYMFGERRYTKCQAEVHGDNAPSLGLHQSLGFVMEGRLRKAVFHESGHQDLIIFGMTVDEFRNLR